MGERTYSVEIGTQRVDLPLVSLNEQLALALLITVDMGVEFMSRAGEELAEIIRPYDVDIVATVATMGIPVVVEVTRHLGLDQYVILHKTPKIHLADAVSESVRSITTDAEQRLLFDRARIKDVAGRRVAIVDDVISTGASTGTALRLLRGVGAEVVVIGTLVTEASVWRTSLGDGRADGARARIDPGISTRRIRWTRRRLGRLALDATMPLDRGPGASRTTYFVGSSSCCLATCRETLPVTFSSTKYTSAATMMPVGTEKSAPPYHPAVHTPCTGLPAHAPP